MFKTIVIGLDGATFTVLDALMAEGQMPRLEELGKERPVTLTVISNSPRSTARATAMSSAII